MQSLDHGVLNLPLTKRGNIDAQLDRYKADALRVKRHEAKIAREALIADRARAKTLFAAVSDERIEAMAKRASISVAQCRKNLQSECHWQPRLIINWLAI